MRTLRPQAHDLSFTVELVSVGSLGHVTFTGHNQEAHSLHVFTLNGRHLASVNTSHRVTGERSKIYCHESRPLFGPFLEESVFPLEMANTCKKILNPKIANR